MGVKAGVYAIYKGDKFLSVGTVPELAKDLNLSINSIFYYKSPAYKKMIRKAKRPYQNCYICIRVE